MSPDEKPWEYDFPKPAGVRKVKGKSEFEEIEELASGLGGGNGGHSRTRGTGACQMAFQKHNTDED